MSLHLVLLVHPDLQDRLSFSSGLFDLAFDLGLFNLEHPNPVVQLGHVVLFGPPLSLHLLQAEPVRATVPSRLSEMRRSNHFFMMGRG